MIYSLLDEGNEGGYFVIDANTGIITTERDLTDATDLPFTLTVVAHDNPVKSTMMRSVSVPVTVSRKNLLMPH